MDIRRKRLRQNASRLASSVDTGPRQHGPCQPARFCKKSLLLLLPAFSAGRWCCWSLVLLMHEGTLSRAADDVPGRITRQRQRGVKRARTPVEATLGTSMANPHRPESCSPTEYSFRIDKKNVPSSPRNICRVLSEFRKPSPTKVISTNMTTYALQVTIKTNLLAEPKHQAPN